MLHVIAELATLSLFSLSGTAVAWLVGFRRWDQILVTALVFATFVRAVTFLLVLGTRVDAESFFVWLVVAALLVLIGLLASRLHKQFILATSGGLALVIVAVVLKFGFQFGERHHADSAIIAANAVLLYAEDNVPGSVRRGFVYPLLLSLGRDGSILSSITPYIFMAALTILAVWARDLSRKYISAPVFVGVSAALGLLLVSTPMFRAAMFYLNSHVLLASAMGIILYVALNSNVTNPFEAKYFSLLLVAGFVGSLSRIEGFVLVWFVLLPLVQHQGVVSWKAKLRLIVVYAVPALSALVWVGTVNPSQLPMTMVTASTVVVGALLLLGLLMNRRFAPLRQHLVVIGSLFIWVLFIVISTMLLPPELVLITIKGQVDNFLGAGGWGFLAPIFVVLLILVSWGRRSRLFWTLLILTFGSLALTFVIKNFDGGGSGYGRAGFWDTINRSWLHFLILYGATVMRGCAETLYSADFSHRRLRKVKTEPTKRAERDVI